MKFQLVLCILLIHMILVVESNYIQKTFVSCIYRDSPQSDRCNIVFGYSSLWFQDNIVEPYSADNTLILTNIAWADIHPPGPIKYFSQGNHPNAWVLNNVSCAIGTYDIKWKVLGSSVSVSSGGYGTGNIKDTSSGCAMGFNGIAKANLSGYDQVDITVAGLGITDIVRPIYLHGANMPLQFAGINSLTASSGIDTEFPEELSGSMYITPLIYDQTFDAVPRNTAVRSGNLYYLININTATDNFYSTFEYEITFETPPNPWPSVPFMVGCDEGQTTPLCNGYSGPIELVESLIGMAGTWVGYNGTHRTMRFGFEFGPGQTGTVIVGPIYDCATFKITNIRSQWDTESTNPYNPYTNTIKLVGFDIDTKDRVLYQSSQIVYDLGSDGFKLCPISTTSVSDPYPNDFGGATRYCHNVDSCGVCGGDNSTCPWDGSSSSYGTSVNSTYSTQCAVSTLYSGSGGDPSGDPLIQLSAEGTYISGYTDVMANIICGGNAVPGVQDTLNSGWVIAASAVGMDNNRVVYSRNFTQMVRLSVLQSCISGVDGLIQGTISIVSTLQSDGTTVHYSTPCAYSIDTQASEVSVSSYSVSGISIQSCVIYQMWIDDVVLPGQNMYTDLTFVIETVIPRSVDSDIMLKDLYVVPVTDAGMPPVIAVSGSPCQESDPRSDVSCVQVWTLVTQDAISRSCFIGGLVLKYSTEIGNPIIINPAPTGSSYISQTDQSGGDSPSVSVSINMNTCKPRGPSVPVQIPRYNITVAFYSDAFLTTTTTHFLDGQRIYASVVIDGLSDCGLDLNINKVTICVAKIPGAPVTSCDSSSVSSALIWNSATGQSGGTRWNTRIEPLFTQPCGSQRLLSWTSRVMSRYSLNSPEVFVQISWDYGYSSGSVVLPSGITRKMTSKRGIIKYESKKSEKKSTQRLIKQWTSKDILGKNTISGIHSGMIHSGGVVVNYGRKDSFGNRVLGFDTPKTRTVSKSMVFHPPCTTCDEDANHLYPLNIGCPTNTQFVPELGECAPIVYLVDRRNDYSSLPWIFTCIGFLYILIAFCTDFVNTTVGSIVNLFSSEPKTKKRRKEAASAEESPQLVVRGGATRRN